jgi:hypothetical protein
MITKDQEKKHKMLTFIMVNMVMVYLADELADEYITKDVKMTFNRYFETFMKRNKDKITTMFNMVTEDEQERGDTFLEAQTYVEILMKDIVDIQLMKEIKDTPIYMFPGLSQLVREYREKSYEAMSRAAEEKGEGEE